MFIYDADDQPEMIDVGESSAASPSWYSAYYGDVHLRYGMNNYDSEYRPTEQSNRSDTSLGDMKSSGWYSSPTQSPVRCAFLQRQTSCQSSTMVPQQNMLASLNGCSYGIHSADRRELDNIKDVPTPRAPHVHLSDDTSGRDDVGEIFLPLGVVDRQAIVSLPPPVASLTYTGDNNCCTMITSDTEYAELLKCSYSAVVRTDPAITLGENTVWSGDDDGKAEQVGKFFSQNPCREQPFVDRRSHEKWLSCRHAEQLPAYDFTLSGPEQIGAPSTVYVTGNDVTKQRATFEQRHSWHAVIPQVSVITARRSCICTTNRANHVNFVETSIKPRPAPSEPRHVTRQCEHVNQWQTSNTLDFSAHKPHQRPARFDDVSISHPYPDDVSDVGGKHSAATMTKHVVTTILKDANNAGATDGITFCWRPSATGHRYVFYFGQRRQAEVSYLRYPDLSD